MLRFVTLFLITSSLALAEPSVPLGLHLEGYDYPYPVIYLNLQIENKAVRMAYMDIAPQGPSNHQTVLLLHGGLAFAAYWKATIQYLSEKGYRVIVPDQIGFGKSSKSNIHFTFHLLAENTKRLLDNLKINKVNIVGHSFGGMIGERMALLYPERVTKLVLEDPLGLEDYRLSIPYQSPETLFQLSLKPTWAAIQNQHKSLYAKWDAKYEEYAEVAYRLSLNPHFSKIARIQASIYEMIYTEPSLYELQSISVPILLMYGNYDRIAPGKNFADPETQKHLGNFPQLIQMAVNKIPQSTIHCFLTSGHVPHLEAATEFNAVLNSFLNG